jgi:hypothetical protein
VARLLFDPADPDFEATGLARACYANGSEIHRVHGTVLKITGRVQGELLRSFRDWLE